MKDAKVSAGRGKTFETRPDFKIEAVTKMVQVNNFGDVIDNGLTNSRVAPFSMPRVRWLERKTA